MATEEKNYEGMYWVEVRGDTAYIRRMDGRDITPAEEARLRKLLRVPPDPKDARLVRK